VPRAYIPLLLLGHASCMVCWRCVGRRLQGLCWGWFAPPIGYVPFSCVPTLGQRAHPVPAWDKTIGELTDVTQAVDPEVDAALFGDF